MTLKWNQVYVENRKLQSQLITYSSDNNDNLSNHQEALEKAIDKMQNERTIRIIIERGEI